MSTTSAQYGAVARMRWQMHRNSLRAMHGKVEFGARIATLAIFSLLFATVAIMLGYSAWLITNSGDLRSLTVVLTPVLLMWQALPILLASFEEQADVNFLLHFPIRFRTYGTLYVFFGLFDLSSLAGGMCLIGICLGMAFAHLPVLPFAVAGLTLFGIFNLLLTRMLVSWLDRWLAQSRTRRILGFLLILCLLAMQLFRSVSLGSSVHFTEQVQNWTPPGLTASFIAYEATGQGIQSIASLGAMILYTLSAGLLLLVRLRAIHRGEHVHIDAPKMESRTPESLRQNWTLQRRSFPSYSISFALFF